jgi:hypothetical protein
MPSESDYPTPHRRVLLVESDFVVVRHAARALAPNPVTAVKNILQAQEFLERYPYDVVVFDPYELTGGLDFLLELTRSQPRIRRVAFSREPGQEQRFGLAHASVHKTADSSELRSAILGRSDSSEFRPIRIL